MRSEAKPQLEATAAEEDWSGHTQTHKEAKKEAKTGEAVPNVQQQKEQKSFPTFTPAEETKPVAEKSYSEIIEEKARKYQEDKQNMDRLNTMGYSVAFGLLDHLTPEQAEKLSKEREEAKKSSSGKVDHLGLPVLGDATAEEVKEKSDRYFPMGYSPAFGLYNDKQEANKAEVEKAKQKVKEKVVEPPVPLKEVVVEVEKLPEEEKESGIEKIKKKVVQDITEAKDKTETVIEDTVDAVASLPGAVVREVKDFGNAVVLSAEDVKDSIVKSTKETQTDLSIKAAEFRKEADKKFEEAKAKGNDLKEVAAELKREAEAKAKELKGAIQAKGEELKESAKVKKKSNEELSAAERKLIGGKPEEEKVNASLKPTEVKKALADSHRQQENDPGSFGRFMAWIFGPFKNPSTDKTLEEDEMNAQSIDRINSIAYSPAGAMYDKGMLRFEHEQEHKEAPRTLGVIAAAEKHDTTAAQLVQVPHYGPVSSAGSYYQGYDSPIPKAEVEERVLEQTIDFFL